MTQHLTRARRRAARRNLAAGRGAGMPVGELWDPNHEPSRGRTRRR
jgi:hypothetical protein